MEQEPWSHLRPFIEKIITLAKKAEKANDAARKLHFRRLAIARVRDKKAVAQLFDERVSEFVDRAGGYTRIYKLGQRIGDAAEMALIELIDGNDEGYDKPKKRAAKKAAKKSAKKSAKKAVAQEEEGDSSVAEDAPEEEKAAAKAEEPAAEEAPKDEAPAEEVAAEEAPAEEEEPKAEEAEESSEEPEEEKKKDA